jgi:hypothetical protein
MKANIMSNIKTSKHTPGPWKYTHEDGLGFYVTSEDQEIKIIDGCGCCDSPWVSGEADARLISAAPELLAALQACLLRDDIAGDELGEVIRSAIAKAL